MESRFDHAVSRRGLLQMGGLLGAGLAVAACGSNNPTGGEPTSAAPGTSAGASATTAFPVTVTDKFGTVTVPREPKSIVSLGYTDADYLLALGFVPVGVTQWIPSWKKGVGSWAESKFGDKSPALFTEPFDFEKVVALAPDLIVNVTSSGAQKDYDKLAPIATTVNTPAGYGAYGVPWSVAASQIARAVGKEAEGNKLIADTKALIQKGASDNPSFQGKTISVVTYYTDKVGVYHTSDTRMRLLTDLGFKATPYVANLGEKDFYNDVSKEQLANLDADIVIGFGEPGDTLTDIFKKVPGFATLGAAKAGKFIDISELEPVMAFSACTPLSIPLALATVLPRLQKATT